MSVMKIFHVLFAAWKKHQPIQTRFHTWIRKDYSLSLNPSNSAMPSKAMATPSIGSRTP